MEGFKHDLGMRLQEIRCDLFGKYGAPLMAEALGLPTRTWLNYESGVTLTADTLLAFLELTKTEACWLRTGAGSKYRLMIDNFG